MLKASRGVGCSCHELGPPQAHATQRGCLAAGAATPASPLQRCCAAWRLRRVEGTVEPSWLVRLQGGDRRSRRSVRRSRLRSTMQAARGREQRPLRCRVRIMLRGRRAADARTRVPQA